MATVFVPPSLRSLTNEAPTVEVSARTVGEVIDRLDERFPGARDILCEGGFLKPGLSVAIDGNLCSRGLLSRLQPESEVHFLPAIGGG